MDPLYHRIPYLFGEAHLGFTLSLEDPFLLPAPSQSLLPDDAFTFCAVPFNTQLLLSSSSVALMWGLLCNPIDLELTRLLWDFPHNTGVGGHSLLQGKCCFSRLPLSRGFPPKLKRFKRGISASVSLTTCGWVLNILILWAAQRTTGYQLVVVV